jgi:hypothetical protein
MLQITAFIWDMTDAVVLNNATLIMKNYTAVIVHLQPA